MIASADGSPLQHARRLGNRLGHLSRYSVVALLEDESPNVSGIPSGALLWAFKQAFKYAGGQSQHWDSFVLPHIAARPSGGQRGKAAATAAVEEAKERLEAPLDPTAQRESARPPAALRAGPEPPRLGDILIECGLLTSRELGMALAEQRKSGGRIGELLVQLGLASPEDIAEALARQAGVTSVDLEEFPADRETVLKLPADFCAEHCLAPLLVRNGFTTLAMAYPSDFRAYRAARKALGDVPVRVVVAPEGDILGLVAQCHRLERDDASGSFVAQ